MWTCLLYTSMQTESFSFSCDTKIYHPQPKKDDVKRVFFYARPVTPRRDFELGLLALDLLCQKMPDVEVVFAGWDLNAYYFPFKYKSLGIITPQQLAEQYTQSDLCFVISNTCLLYTSWTRRLESISSSM